MASFEGMRPRAGALANRRPLRFKAVYAAAIAALAFEVGLLTVQTAGRDDPLTAPSPGVEPANVMVLHPAAPPVHESPVYVQDLIWQSPAYPQDLVPLGFEPPAAPLPPPEPEPVLQTAPGTPPQAAAPSSKPVSAPAAPPAPPPPPAAKPNFYLPEVSAGPLTGLEQRLLDGINAQRAQAGLGAYVLDASLSKIARTRSQQMADQGYFGHVDPYGYSMYVELLQKFGIGYGWAGENLAMNNYGVGESPERAIVSLMKSPSHAANILAGDFKRIGIGEVTTADGRHIYTMIFVG